MSRHGVIGIGALPDWIFDVVCVVSGAFRSISPYAGALRP